VIETWTGDQDWTGHTLPLCPLVNYDRSLVYNTLHYFFFGVDRWTGEIRILLLDVSPDSTHMMDLSSILSTCPARCNIPQYKKMGWTGRVLPGARSS
jgi:hypothetical protein